MSKRSRIISVDQLEPGMFVTRLDRPWLETPFPLQGFYIRDLRDIDAIKSYCRRVYVEERKVFLAAASAPEAQTVPVSTEVMQPRPRSRVALKVEVSRCLAALREHKSILDQADQCLKVADAQVVELVRRVAQDQVVSVLRHPDALVWVAHMAAAETAERMRSLRTSVWAVVLGRHLGLSPTSLQILAMAVLFMDVGTQVLKTQVGRMRDPRDHVLLSVAAMKRMDDMDPLLLSLVEQHHERNDGSGYPRGLSGRLIHPMAKIMGLADHFDHLLFAEDAAQSMSSTEAMAQLYALRNRGFQASLVDEFIQALGIYPSGSLVRLSDQRIAMVLEQNAGQKFRPKLLVLSKPDERRLSRPVYLDLQHVFSDHQGQPLKVAAGLKTGSYGYCPQLEYLDSLGGSTGSTLAATGSVG